MSLENLAAISQLERISPDAGDIARLLEAAARSLSDARLSGLSAEGRFDMAYKAVMQTANAALQANGYRTLTSKPGHHATMIQTLPMTVGLDKTSMVVLDALRKQRNVIDYSGELVSDAMAAEAVARAEALIGRVREWLAENKPELLQR
jgi:hypothetical protein